MKRSLLALLIVVLVGSLLGSALPAQAGPPDKTKDMPIDWTFTNPCEGGVNVHVTGTARFVYQYKETKKGGLHYKSDLHLSGLSAVDDNGVSYQVRYKSRSSENSRGNDGHYVIRETFSLELISHNGQSWSEGYNYRLTVNNGEVKSGDFESWAYCH